MLDYPKKTCQELSWKFTRRELHQNFPEIRSYESLGCNMNIKLYFAYSHLHNFPKNLDDVGDEKGVLFHRNVKAMEERYQMRWDVNVMANYCWSIKRESPRNLLRGDSLTDINCT